MKRRKFLGITIGSAAVAATGVAVAKLPVEANKKRSAALHELNVDAKKTIPTIWDDDKLADWCYENMDEAIIKALTEI